MAFFTKVAFWRSLEKRFDHEYIIDKCTWDCSRFYKNIEIVDNYDQCDLIVTDGDLPKEFDRSKCIVIQPEPPIFRSLFFGKEWVNPNKEEFFYVFDKHWAYYHYMDTDDTMPFLYEFRNKKSSWDYRFKLVSFISNKIPQPVDGYNWKSDLRGYTQRLIFSIDFLDKLDYYNCWCATFIGSWYDPITKLQLKMRSYHPETKKNKVLPNSLYVFDCENSFYKNYFCEKILTPLFYNCVVFYSGCPNIEEFIDPICYIKLNLEHNMEDRS